MESLEVRQELPPGFLDMAATEIYREFSGPTLIHLPGERSPAVFVSILLHGNEEVGLKAVQRSLRSLGERPLPREMILLIGNPQAAKAGLRKLPEQEDFNRVWPGTDHPASAIRECMQAVCQYAEQRGLFVSLDLHNNSGTNPFYSCINRVDSQSLHLALLFARTVVYFRRPLGVQSAAMAKICPAITCECGQIGNETGVEHASDLITACLHLLELPTYPPPASDYHLLHTIATVKIPPQCSVAFDDCRSPADFQFAADFDHLNFRPLPARTVIGRRRTECREGLMVTDEEGRDMASHYFEIVQREIVLRVPTIASMLTPNERAVLDDCLGYLMEEYPLPEATSFLKKH